MGDRNNKNKNNMKNMNTTLEIPEGSKATIQGKIIDGKNYLVVEVENKSDMIDIEEKARIMLEKTRAEMNPEWTKFKRGDVLKGNSGVMVLFDKFYYEYSMERHALEIAFRSLINNKGAGNDRWKVDAFTPASDKEKAKFFKWLRDDKGLEWDGEKLVEVLKEGDLAIFWNANPKTAFIAFFGGFDSSFRNHVDRCGIYWENAIKWDGTKEQYERVLRGEL